MANKVQSPARTGVVILLTDGPGSAHETQVRSHLAGQLAGLLNLPFKGVRTGRSLIDPGLYVIPDATLVAPQPGIHTERDLFGGLVAHPFMASKAISHPLIDADASAPIGWTDQFMQLAGDVVLPGFSAFALDDARRAGELLLREGPVRGKEVMARAGRGQRVICTLAELDTWLAGLDAATVAQEGLVLERNLDDVRTYSVGQVRVGGQVASYFGQQHLTTANDGAAVYGGSELWLVRGDYDALLQQITDPLTGQLIDQARRYEQAAERAFPGFLASRRNYDVALGRDSAGRQCTGVLEQSWRIGGASSAEIHGLVALAADPSLQRLCASSWEAYGEAPDVPEGVTVLHQGDAPATGPITIGVRINPWQQPVKLSN